MSLLLTNDEKALLARTVRVRAIQLGYFGHERRYPIDHPGKRQYTDPVKPGPAGAPFDVPLSQFSQNWMEPLDQDGSTMDPAECVDLLRDVAAARVVGTRVARALAAAHNDRGIGPKIASNIKKALEQMNEDIKKAGATAAAETKEEPEEPLVVPDTDPTPARKRR